ncbi:hypothetical protein [Paenibacillus sp. VT-400]|nr:hypothetical protein [Paenibacillus sp. VT-400]
MPNLLPSKFEDTIERAFKPAECRSVNGRAWSQTTWSGALTNL